MAQDSHNVIFTSHGRNKKRMKSSWSSEDEDTVHQKVEETREEKYERVQLLQTLITLQKRPDTQRAFEILKEDISRKPYLLPLRTDHKGNKHVQSFEQLMKHADDYESEFRRLYSETVKKPDNPNSNKKFREAANLTPGNIFCGQVNQKTEIAVHQMELGGPRPTKDSPLPIYYDSWKQLTTLDGHSQPTYCVVFDKTGRRVFTGSDDSLIRVWCTSTGSLLRALYGHTKAIVDMTINCKNDLLATSSNDKTVVVWSLDTYTAIHRFGMDEMATSILFSPTPIAENRYLIATSDNWHTWVCKYNDTDNSFGPTSKIKPVNAVGSNNRMKCTSFNYTGSMFAISGTDGLIRVYSTIGGTALYDNTNKKGKKAKKPFDLVEIIKQSSDPDDSDDSDDDLISMPTRVVGNGSNNNNDIKNNNSDNSNNDDDLFADMNMDMARSLLLAGVKSFNGQNIIQSAGKEFVAPIQNRQTISPLSRHYNVIPSTSKQSIVNTVSSPTISLSLESTSQSHSSSNHSQLSTTIQSSAMIVSHSQSTSNPIVQTRHVTHSLSTSETQASKPLLISSSGPMTRVARSRSRYQSSRNNTSISAPVSPGYISSAGEASDTLSVNAISRRINRNNNRRTNASAPASPGRNISLSRSINYTNNNVITPATVQNGDDDDPNLMNLANYFDPVHIADLDGHTAIVNSLEFAHRSNRLLSGAEDGTARVWEYNYTYKQWTSIILDVRGSNNNTKVTSMRWSLDDTKVIIGNNYGIITIFDSENGEVRVRINAHNDKIFVLDIHPHDCRVMMSAGYDGRIVMWDIIDGRSIKVWDPSNLEFLGDTLFLDGKFRDDGEMFAVSDGKGKCHLIGIDQTCNYDKYRMRAQNGQRFFEDYTTRSVVFSEREWTFIDNDSGLPIDPSQQTEVLSLGGVQYERQVPISLAQGRRSRLSSKRLKPDIENKKQILIEEVNKLQQGAIVKVVLNKREVSVRRKKIQIPEEDDDDNYMDIDPLAIEEPIIPLPDDDIDPDYEPGHTDNERSDSDSDGSCNSIVIENNISMDEYYESMAEDSDFEPRKTRSKKARAAMSTRRTKRQPNYSDHEESVIESSRKSRRKRRRVSYKDYYDSSSDEPSTPSDDVYEDESADISGADPTSPYRGSENDQDDVDAAILAAVEDDVDNRPEWIKSVNPKSIYIPQRGDIVAYFYKGHRTFVERSTTEFPDSKLAKDLSKKSAINALPYNRNQLNDIVFLEIRDVKWFSGPPSYATVSCVILEYTSTGDSLYPMEPDFQQTNQKVDISYFDIDGVCEFLVLYKRFVTGVNQSFEVNEKVVVRLDSTDFSGTIAKVNPLDDNSWCEFPTYLVQWDEEGQEPSDFFTWEIRKSGIPEVDCSQLTEDERGIFDEVLTEFIGNEDYALFHEHVDFARYADYLDHVPYPMCLDMILKRVRNGFYRCKQGFKSDLDQIAINAVAYNKRNSAIAKLASQMVSEIEAACNNRGAPLGGGPSKKWKGKAKAS
ncbi:WD40 repeat-like protein [Gigaspora margarita]|uniref:WD40 repeat-like protein n=2 Tax=Gigaspora margarita TaxID=4874 RepID=A0A8H4B3X3_GIGMA|nr:WD40 repeat-like protein [Gigaspora margarita]